MTQPNETNTDAEVRLGAELLFGAAPELISLKDRFGVDDPNVGIDYYRLIIAINRITSEIMWLKAERSLAHGRRPSQSGSG